MSSNGYYLSLLLLGRMCGFFFFSPLFYRKGIPKLLLFFFAFACALLLAPPLFGPNSQSLETLRFEVSAQLVIDIIKEVAIGYFVGFIFSLLFEAAAFGGEVVGALMGFSATEILDPLSTTRHPLMGSFFSLIAFALFLTLDLHHALLRYLYGSFRSLPLGENPFSANVMKGAIFATGQLFHYALEFALLPMLVLLALIALFALLSRFFSIFWVGFPMQLLLGFIAIGASVYFFIPVVKESFFDLLNILRKIHGF